MRQLEKGLIFFFPRSGNRSIFSPQYPQSCFLSYVCWVLFSLWEKSSCPSLFTHMESSRRHFCVEAYPVCSDFCQQSGIPRLNMSRCTKTCILLTDLASSISRMSFVDLPVWQPPCHLNAEMKICTLSLYWGFPGWDARMESPVRDRRERGIPQLGLELLSISGQG